MTDTLRQFLAHVDRMQRIADDIHAMAGELEVYKACLSIEQMRNSNLAKELEKARAENKAATSGHEVTIWEFLKKPPT